MSTNQERRAEARQRLREEMQIEFVVSDSRLAIIDATRVSRSSRASVRIATALVRDGIERQRLIASLYAAQEESAALTDELARVQRAQGVTSERTRLSRDIHDGIAQGFSSLLLLARAARAEGDADRTAVGGALVRGEEAGQDVARRAGGAAIGKGHADQPGGG